MKTLFALVIGVSLLSGCNSKSKEPVDEISESMEEIIKQTDFILAYDKGVRMMNRDIPYNLTRKRSKHLQSAVDYVWNFYSDSLMNSGKENFLKSLMTLRDEYPIPKTWDNVADSTSRWIFLNYVIQAYPENSIFFENNIDTLRGNPNEHLYKLTSGDKNRFLVVIRRDKEDKPIVAVKNAGE